MNTPKTPTAATRELRKLLERDNLTGPYNPVWHPYKHRSGDMVMVDLYTATQVYTISAVPESNGRRSYLGCINHNRAPDVGEEHTRGCDLTDGPFTEETWHGILADIVRMEMVRPTQPPVLRCGRRLKGKGRKR